MQDHIDLKYFTVGEIKDWLIHNKHIDGLGEKVISKQRAWAFVNAPAASDEMEIVSALYVNGELAAFTACFPEILVKPKSELVFWYSTLYCKPEYRGRGYGLYVLGHLAEAHPGQMMDIAAIEETNEGLKMLGFDISWFNQYQITLKKDICAKGLKGRLAYLKEYVNQLVLSSKRSKILTNCLFSGYTVEYTSHIDDESYTFISQHTNKDLFVRATDTFNWILMYDYYISSPLTEKTGYQNPFPSQVQDTHIQCVKVFVRSRLVGIYILKYSGRCLSVKYLYYNKAFIEQVFSSILAHLLKSGKKEFITNMKELNDYVVAFSIHSKTRILKTSYANTEGYELVENSIQAGDGDMLT